MTRAGAALLAALAFAPAALVAQVGLPPAPSGPFAIRGDMGTTSEAYGISGAPARRPWGTQQLYLNPTISLWGSVDLTVNLLVIVFLGGVGTLRGVLIGAVLFTTLPEVLRMAPTWRLVIYGALLLVIVIRSPQGLDGLLRRPASAPGR